MGQAGVDGGRCAELWGKDRGSVRIGVEAVAREGFKQWLAQRKPPPAAPAAPAAPAEPAARAGEAPAAPAAPAAAEAGTPATAASGA